jgi:SAM-dependent methyltransferase
VSAGADRPFHYDQIADAYAAGVDSAPYNAHYERPAMLGMLPPVSGARVLDAGCAAGWYAAQLAQRGASVTAVDASVAMVEHARRRFASSEMAALASRVELRVADLGRLLSFAADASFDGIVASLVLHYLRDWNPTLVEFRRILKPAGWLLFSTHHPAAEALRLQRPRYLEVEPVEDDWKWVGKVRYYSRPLSAIVNALAPAGFAIEKLVEPLPNDEFQAAHPESYARLVKQPDFLLVMARPWRR